MVSPRFAMRGLPLPSIHTASRTSSPLMDRTSAGSAESLRSIQPQSEFPTFQWLVRQKGLALHNKQGKRRKADVRHRVVQLRIRAAPRIRENQRKPSAVPPKATWRSPRLNKAQLLALEIATWVPRAFRTAGIFDRSFTNDTDTIYNSHRERMGLSRCK
jgi:hypothetical protein